MSSAGRASGRTDGPTHVAGGRRHPRHSDLRSLFAGIVAAGVVFLAAGCGGPSPTGRGNRPAGGGSTGSGSQTSSLAFSRCVRSHGVPTFPDPNGRGVWPKSQVVSAAGSPRYAAAARACGHLLPDGGPGVAPSPAVVEEIQADMVKFARCMRSHGVPDWPDPTLTQGRSIFDPQAVGINANAPRVSATMRGCQRVFPASVGLPPGA
jgi:hypothetical protein